MSPEAVSSPQGTQACFPIAIQEMVAGSAMADKSGPASSRGAGPLPAWFGDGADAAGASPGPDGHMPPGFNPALEYGAVFGLGAVGYDSHIPLRKETPLGTMVRATGLANRPPGKKGGGL